MTGAEADIAAFNAGIAQQDAEDLQRSKAAEIRWRQMFNQVVHERDRLMTRVEDLEATLELNRRTMNFMPVVGLVCDGDGCTAAIGVVGVKLASSDAITPACLTIATHIGWTFVLSSTDGPGVRPRHYCPSCKDKESST